MTRPAGKVDSSSWRRDLSFFSASVGKQGTQGPPGHAAAPRVSTIGPGGPTALPPPSAVGQACSPGLKRNHHTPHHHNHHQWQQHRQPAGELLRVVWGHHVPAACLVTVIVKLGVVCASWVAAALDQHQHQQHHYHSP
eukprot:CAMPEP_0202920162 /NCGR_PEP_ID=MMETSP1392-20130828/76711_1 /ASSEMBLY_ACC=CAM_ASM_000868 /TAXON_ID=225041 /ORGANISM="Chlamydomonas chlamydogama, Strain SAG 11-48b" /LENGTH=137 /DNA_ID=CAMNT_0049613645 /DNA_START=1782 /DNA_END=2196 /DNA_ORIENTATION=+